MDESARPIEILLVEDNAGDVRLTIEALKGANVSHQLRVVSDGVEAWDYLHQQGRHVDAPRPDLILMDLNLPKRDGREVLSQIKSDKNLKTIPVIVLTTSRREQDILESYEHQANCYIVKPVNLDQFIHAVQSIEDFWFKVVTLPIEDDSTAFKN